MMANFRNVLFVFITHYKIDKKMIEEAQKYILYFMLHNMTNFNTY